MTFYAQSKAVCAIFFLLLATAAAARNNLRGRRQLEPFRENVDDSTASDAPTEAFGDSGGVIFVDTKEIPKPAAAEQTPEETAAVPAAEDEEEPVAVEATSDSITEDAQPDLEGAYWEEEERMALAMAAHEHEEMMIRIQMMADQALYEQELARAQIGDIASREVYDEALRREHEADRQRMEALENLRAEDGANVELPQASQAERR